MNRVKWVSTMLLHPSHALNAVCNLSVSTIVNVFDAMTSMKIAAKNGKKDKYTAFSIYNCICFYTMCKVDLTCSVTICVFLLLLVFEIFLLVDSVYTNWISG